MTCLRRSTLGAKTIGVRSKRIESSLRIFVSPMPGSDFPRYSHGVEAVPQSCGACHDRRRLILDRSNGLGFRQTTCRDVIYVFLKGATINLDYSR